MNEKGKAMAYDKVRKKIALIFGPNVAEEIFSEFEESEDERIRKGLIKAVSGTMKGITLFGTNVTREEALAWLEKEGQKPTYKSEPNFKVGDWIVTDKNNITQIKAVNNGYYTIDNGMDFNMSYVDKCWRLWTIQDAKDGDVLWHSDSASNGIFIFKEIRYDGKVLCYCDYDSEDYFCLGEHHTCCWANAKILHPATKEQRDLLFQKMKEAGLEWDADKKKLKKLTQSVTKTSDKGWSEEDERIYQSIIDDTVQENQLDSKQIDWLKNIKYRNFA